jgi:hypothetical protein
MKDILIGIGLLIIICAMSVCGCGECCCEICMDNQNIIEPDNETPTNNTVPGISSPIHDDNELHIEI